MTAEKERLSERWRRFRRRSSEERSLIVIATFLFRLVRIGLRILGFWRCKALLNRFSARVRASSSSQNTNVEEVVLRTRRAVLSGELHGPFRPNCLERSLTLWWLLRRRGIESELHIGARMKAARFEAHAWVELDGQVLNDSAEVHNHYARFDAPIAGADSILENVEGETAIKAGLR